MKGALQIKCIIIIIAKTVQKKMTFSLCFPFLRDFASFMAICEHWLLAKAHIEIQLHILVSLCAVWSSDHITDSADRLSGQEGSGSKLQMSAPVSPVLDCQSVQNTTCS